MIHTAADVECHHRALTGGLDGNGPRYECMASVSAKMQVAHLLQLSYDNMSLQF